MSSIIKVNTIQDAGGNQILTSDGSGVITGNLSARPAFEATISGDKNMTADGVYTKAPFDETRFDTDSAYDATTNYRFTVPTGQGGKYFVYSIMRMETGANTRLEYWYNIFYKNGSESTASHSNLNANPGRSFSTTHYGIIELAASDYIENYYAISVSTGTPFLDRSEGGGSNAALNTIFGAYKLPGV